LRENMIKRLRTNFDTGVEKIKWFSSILSDRLKIEFSLIKLLHQSDQLEKKRDELMKNIGRRIYELKETSDRSILKDRVVMDAMNEIAKIDSDIESTKKKASEISST
jgi:predicted transcriptional regulator